MGNFMQDESKLLFKKRPHYYNAVREDLIKLIPRIQGRFLEIGCGAGLTLEYLKTKGAAYVAGVDKSSEAIKVALDKRIDAAICADIETEELPFDEKEFDYIILADLLEHLYNPWDTLKRVTRLLKNDGYILMSIPNVKYFLILWNLIFHDEWRYSDAGILDNTHLRFFTLTEIMRLIDYACLKIAKIECYRLYGKKFGIINFIFFDKLKSFSIVQYHILVKKKAIIQIN
ncbi:MAG: hypothetical protein A2Y62_10830, partial [Candidatus Fischerbacteria bacterium RBG_13_37_8]